MGYIANKPFVKVSIGAADGNRVASILREGQTVPEGVADELLKSLEKRGLIAKVKDEETTTEVVIPDGDPTEQWKGAELDAYAAREGIDIKGKTNKADKLTAILAAKQPAS